MYVYIFVFESNPVNTVTPYPSRTPRYGVCRIVFEVAAAGDWSSTFEIDVLVQRHLQPLGAGTTEVWG